MSIDFNQLWDRHMLAVARTGFLEGVMDSAARELERRGESVDLAKHLREQANTDSFTNQHPGNGEGDEG